MVKHLLVNRISTILKVSPYNTLINYKGEKVVGSLTDPKDQLTSSGMGKPDTMFFPL